MTDRELGKPCMIKPIKKTTINARRKFDETFKREAVNNRLSSGKSADVIAQELGLKVERLYSWRKCFAPTPALTSKRGLAHSSESRFVVPQRRKCAIKFAPFLFCSPASNPVAHFTRAPGDHAYKA